MNARAARAAQPLVGRADRGVEAFEREREPREGLGGVDHGHRPDPTGRFEDGIDVCDATVGRLDRAPPRRRR